MNDFAIGHNLIVGFQKEASYNTANNASLKGVYIKPSESLQEEVSRGDAGNARSTKYKMVNERRPLLKSWTGSVSGVIPKNGFGWVVLPCFETMSTDAGGSNFVLNEGSTDSYTAHLERDNQYYNYTGGKPTGLNLDFSGEFPTWELPMQGGDVSSTASSTDVTINADDNVFNRNEVSLKIGTANTDGDLTAINVTAGTLSIAFTNSDGEDVSYKLGEDSRQRLITIDGVVTGNFTFVYDKDDSALAQLEADFRAGTKRSLQWYLNDSTDSIKINLLNCDLAVYAAPIGNTNLRRVSVDYEAFKSSTQTAVKFIIDDDYNLTGYAW
jgi:hypothetical protein